ncbi:MAG: hypothetical protein ACYDBB_17140 [Armatimonadota bacterium]
MMDRRRGAWGSVLVLLVCLGQAWGIETPKPPQVTVVGPPGQATACYWVVAADGLPPTTYRDHGNLTLASKPVVVTTVPDTLTTEQYVSIQVAPVEGAARYYVLKSIPWREPAPVTVTVANPGEKTYYYWLVACNGFRQSGVYGPYPAKNCGDPTGNVIQWTPVPGVTWFDLYRTETPEPPVGRTHCVVGVKLGAAPGQRFKATDMQFTDQGAVRYGVTGYPATPLSEPLLGQGLFLLAETTGGEVRDTGQPLRLFTVPNVNETVTTPVPMIGDGKTADIRDFNQAKIQSTINLPHLKEPSFLSIMRALDIRQNAEAGGHNEYHNYPGYAGWKSTFEALSVQQTLQTASQGFSVAGYQRNYGMGDTIWLFASTTVEGGNADQGDEGVFTIRGRVQRQMSLLAGSLRADAPRGGVVLPLKGLPGQAGTKRLVINVSQGYRAGRIRRVGNVDVYGTGTQWTPEMVGRWISFDIDTEAGNRLWYQIVAVTSPTELTMLARTLWSEKCNLGYSRFIYDHAEQQFPTPYYTHDRALKVLPKEKTEASQRGEYLICPGTLLGSPWHTGNDLQVEPLREAWRAGDQISIAAGPSARLFAGNLKVYGNFTPQDDVGGLEIECWGNRTANSPGVQIGTTGMANFQTGVLVCLPKNGYGTGIEVSAADNWDERGLPTGNIGGRAAFVAPMNVPALMGERGWFPYLYFNGTELGKGTLQIRNNRNDPVLTVGQEDVTCTRPATFTKNVVVQGVFTGSARTRGKAFFDGDGATRAFTVRFTPAYDSEPFVTISTNQFAASRLAEVAADHLTVEFAEPPAAGKGNVTIYWAAQL